MLQPKRTKYRKMHKGSNRGLALRGNKVSFVILDCKQLIVVVLRLVKLKRQDAR